MTSTHLVALGNADAVRWVLSNQRMAFTEVGRRSAARVERGDKLVFYASLKCWPALGGEKRPKSGLLIGDAVVLTDVTRLQEPVQVGGRRFQFGCEVFFENLAPLGSGASISELRDRLSLTAGRENFGQALRRTPVLLSPNDTRLLSKELEASATSFEESVDSYFSNRTP